MSERHEDQFDLITKATQVCTEPCFDNMERKTRHWGVLAFVAFIAIILLAQKPMAPRRLTARRMQGLNVVPRLDVTFPLTNFSGTNSAAFPVRVH
jgi:hypothetical protein